MFGIELKHRRKAAGLTQAQLGRLAGVSASGVGMIEQGRRQPSPKARARLLWALRGTKPPTYSQAGEAALHRALNGLKGPADDARNKS